MKKCYSGNEAERDNRRERALKHIKQFVLPNGEQPEHYLWEQLKQSNNDLATIAQNIGAVGNDKHAYLYDVQVASGESRESFLTQLTDIVCKMPFWNGYIAELSVWADARKTALGIQ